jgi:hypothetical protein
MEVKTASEIVTKIVIRKVSLYALLIGLSIHCLSCGSTKTSISYREVEKGNELDKIPEVSFDTFLTRWIQKTNDERGVSVRQVYKDSTYTYFWARGNNYYKVQNGRLAKVDYTSIDGDSIRAIFYQEIIPAGDKKKGDGCGTASIDVDYEYDFIEQENALMIKCHYKVKCELIRVVNKDYTAKYTIRTGEIIKI